jgi:hypothetical protein
MESVYHAWVCISSEIHQSDKLSHDLLGNLSVYRREISQPISRSELPPRLGVSDPDGERLERK